MLNILAHGIIAQRTTTGTNDIVKLNYGIVLVRINNVCIMDGAWSHIYRLSLPFRPRATGTLKPLDIVKCEDECVRAKAIYQSYRNMSAVLRNSVTKLVDRIYSLTGIARNIPLIRPVTTRVRQKRGKANIIGELSEWALVPRP